MWKSQDIFFPIGTQTTFVPFSFEVSHANTNEVVYIGRVGDFEPMEAGSDEALEFVIEDYQYELSVEGTPDITAGSIKLFFEDTSLNFDPELLRIAKFHNGQWVSLGGIIDGESISTTESFSLPATFALAKAAEQTEVPEFLTLQNITLPGTTDTCFAATQTITLAGEGSTFTVESEAILRIIAGQSIRAWPHTHFQSGSTVHLFIDETETWCGQPESLLLAKSEEPLDQSIPSIEKRDGDTAIRMYPNPTSGLLHIQTEHTSEMREINYMVFNIMGERVLSGIISGAMQTTLDLSTYPSGIYIIHMLSPSQSITQKVIKK